MVLYLLYLAGMFYTGDTTRGGFDLEVKLSLVVFPLCFYFTKLDIQNRLSNIWKAFIDGCLVAGVLCLINALAYAGLTGKGTYLVYNDLSIFHHPSYYSLYLNLGLIVVYYYSFKPVPSLILKPLKATVLIAFFSIIIGLLASRTGIITMILIHISATLYYTIKHKYYLKGIISLLILGIGFGVTYNYSAGFKGRINETFNVFGDDVQGASSSTARVEIWKVAAELVKEEPILGFGTGFVKENLVKAYNEHGLVKLVHKELNAHNQFIQTTLAIGIIGGLVLLAMFILPVYYSVKTKFMVFVLFQGLVFINFLTESMLETQSGVVFYAFFNSLLLIILVHKISESRKSIIPQ